MVEVKAPFLPSANIMVTGGAGFIGSCFIRYVLERTNFSGRIINYDKLTYAGNLLNLEDIRQEVRHEPILLRTGGYLRPRQGAAAAQNP